MPENSPQIKFKFRGGLFSGTFSENPSEVQNVSNEILKNRNLQNHPLSITFISSFSLMLREGFKKNIKKLIEFSI